MSAPITFVVPGVSADGSTRGARAAAPPSIGHLKASVTVTAQRSAGDSNIRTQAVPGEEIVVIDIAGGPSLWLHPESARDLLREAARATNKIATLVTLVACVSQRTMEPSWGPASCMGYKHRKFCAKHRGSATECAGIVNSGHSEPIQ
jgi:hypothetical protein